MSRNTLLAVAVVCFGSIGAMAQNTTPQSSQAKRDPTLITVTGCLERGPQANTFMLTRVPDPLVDSVTAAGGGAIPTVTYQLSGGQNLGAHLGHKIEVTGKGPLKPQAAVKVTDAESKTEQSNGKTTARTEVKEKAAIAVRPLAVDSVRMISTDCSAK